MPSVKLVAGIDRHIDFARENPNVVFVMTNNQALTFTLVLHNVGKINLNHLET